MIYNLNGGDRVLRFELRVIHFLNKQFRNLVLVSVRSV